MTRSICARSSALRFFIDSSTTNESGTPLHATVSPEAGSRSRVVTDFAVVSSETDQVFRGATVRFVAPDSITTETVPFVPPSAIAAQKRIASEPENLKESEDMVEFE